MSTKHTPYIDEDMVLRDPGAVAFVSAVKRENVRRMLVSDHAERIRHFALRVAALGRSPRDTLVVVLNVNDPNGAALADVLMPGGPWSEIRARGEVPWARGLVERGGIQEVFDHRFPEAAAELRDIDGVAVVAMDRGVVAAFSMKQATT